LSDKAALLTAVVHCLGYPLSSFCEHVWVDVKDLHMRIAICVFFPRMIEYPKGNVT
jgi:hypothetical protein